MCPRNRIPGGSVWGSMAARVLALLLLAAQLEAAPALDALLAKMDAAAAVWTGMRARVERLRYNALVEDSNTEEGRLAVRRSAPGNVELLISFERPNEYYLLVQGARAQVYKPKTKTVEEYNLQGSMDKVRSALLLGFGTAGRLLREHYEISVEGDEAVAGQEAAKLDLVPRNPAGETHNRPLQMWVSTAMWQPVRQKILEGGAGDFVQYSYSEVELNPAFGASEFKLKLARGTRRVRPQR